MEKEAVRLSDARPKRLQRAPKARGRPELIRVHLRVMDDR